MTAPDPAAPVPPRPTFRSVRAAVQQCRAGKLWEGSTQAVMGAGPAPSRAPTAAMDDFVADLRAVARWLDDQ
jgi:hypothetical protein